MGKKMREYLRLQNIKAKALGEEAEQLAKDKWQSKEERIAELEEIIDNNQALIQTVEHLAVMAGLRNLRKSMDLEEVDEIDHEFILETYVKEYAIKERADDKKEIDSLSERIEELEAQLAKERARGAGTACLRADTHRQKGG